MSLVLYMYSLLASLKAKTVNGLKKIKDGEQKPFQKRGETEKPNE